MTTPTPAQNPELTKLSRHPFQIFVMVAAMLTGVPILLGGVPGPGSLRAALPPNGVYAWSALFCIGGILALVGASMRNRVNGLLTEQVGLGFVGSACLLYGGLLVVLVQWDRASVSIALLSALTVASVWRFIDIQLLLKRIRVVSKKIEEMEQ